MENEVPKSYVGKWADSVLIKMLAIIALCQNIMNKKLISVSFERTVHNVILNKFTEAIFKW